MPQKFLFALVAAVVVIVGFQFHLAHQLSSMERQTLAAFKAETDSLRRNDTDRATAPLVAKLAATTGALESISDQLNTEGRDHFDPQRLRRNLLRQMRQLKDRPFIVVIGDSITQRAPLPDTICGLPIINAGISGSRTSDFIPFAELMVAQNIKPALIIVALGINDAQSRFKTAKSFGAAYNLLLADLPNVPIAVATLAPVDFTGTDGKNIVAAKVDLIDKSIRDDAVSRGLNVIDLGKLDDDGPFQTIDGLHPTVDGYVAWNAAVLSGIKDILPSVCRTSELQ